MQNKLVYNILDNICYTAKRRKVGREPHWREEEQDLFHFLMKKKQKMPRSHNRSVICKHGR